METSVNQENKDFRAFLRAELARRCKKNPAYSLRAFAKLLGVSHPALSQILSGKRPLTSKAQKRMAEALSLSPEAYLEFKISRDISFEEQFQKLDTEQFDIFADPIHDAILELTHLKCFQPKSQWIATVLDVNIHQVHAAVERLKHAQLLKIEKSGRWKDLSHYNTNNHLGDFTNSALKTYQKQILEKSTDALESLPREERDHTSLMLKFSKKNMQDAKKLIKEFRTRFSADVVPQNKTADNVYALQISFFPVSKTQEGL